jgi:curved DNA-binding protein CbpA
MSGEQMNHYQMLGISENASFDEIRAVYRRLAFQYHPDRNSEPGAQEFFQKVIEAFSVLSDPEARRNYDAILFPDSSLISSAITDSTLSASELYDSVAAKAGDRKLPSEREEYLAHLRKSRRRRTVIQTILAIIIIILLLLYGFKPLQSSSQGVAPSTSSGSTSQGSSSSSSGSSGSSLNQNLIVSQGPQGIQGVAGPAGRDGRIGVDGKQGPAGADGKDGSVGPAGPAGPTGATGEAGSAGANGANGVAGAQGPAGANGTAGPAGSVGPAGPAGRDGQDATVYTVKPNIGGAQGIIAPCNQDLNDTATAPGLDVTIDTRFDVATERYTIAAINLKGFPSSCRGVLVGINMVLASNATSHPNAVFQCTKTLPSNFTAPYTYSFTSGSTDCTKYSGSWGSSGTLDLGTVVASDLARINLIVSG